MIPWKSIAEMPGHLKDGRDVLVWEGCLALVVRWSEERWYDSGPGWNDTREGGPVDEVTHYCEITPP
jgi:hypothetical protein